MLHLNEKKYQVQAVIKLLIVAPIMAASLEEAVAKAEQLKVSDFIKTQEDCINHCHHFRILGANESDVDLRKL